MYHCANLEGWFPYPENKDCQPWGVVDREPEQREDLVAAKLFLGFLPAHIFILYHFPISAYWLRAFWLFFLLSSYVGFLLCRFIKYSNCPSSFSFHFHLKLALSVRRKWERKLGLFMALPVASDLKIFTFKKLFKINFNNALTRKQLLHDGHLVIILSILGRTVGPQVDLLWPRTKGLEQRRLSDRGRGGQQVKWGRRAHLQK